MPKTMYLIDGSAYIYRAYHAIAPLTTSKGVATNAILGFINMIQRLKKECTPHYIAIAFDAKGTTFRHNIYSEYKANRPPMPEDLREQLPWIKHFVEASGLVSLEQTGVEADDILATLAKKIASAGYNVVIVSGDKDLLQLVNNDITLFDPMKNKYFGTKEVEEKYGVKIEQLLDYFSLVGDSADNVPGVPGVGPKTAVKLIQEYGSLEELYKNIDTTKKSKLKEKIIANKEQAFLSKELIALKEDVVIDTTIETYQVGEEDSSALYKIYSELEFKSLLKGLGNKKNERIDNNIFHTIRTKEELADLAKELEVAEYIAFDTETTSLNARKASLVGISLCCSLEKVYYIPMGHKKEDGTLQDNQLATEFVLDTLTPFLTGKSTKIAHNLKYDYTILLRHNIQLGGKLFDTLIAGHLLEMGRSLKLDDLTSNYGLQLTSFKEVVENDKREDCFAYVAIDDASNYGCEDSYAAYLLWQHFSPLLEEKGVEHLFYKVEMPIVPILAEMELAGITLDTAVLSELKEIFTAKLINLEKEIYTLAGREFTIGSPKQLSAILFEELGLPHGRKTKTGYSTDVKVLEKLAPQHPLPEKILEYRSFAKLLSTYVDGLTAQKEANGRVHTTFNQAVTATGRLSSTDPNLQNIPIRSEEGGRIRQALVSQKGNLFLSADYSQIDLRVLAVYSQDKALIEAICSGGDIHNRTAAEIFAVSEMMVTSEMRRVAKSINFGIVYGMSAFGLASQLNISNKDAQRFIDRYFGLYTGVQKFMQDIVSRAKQDGYVTTLLGRRRTLSDLQAKNRNQREFAERMAINTPIQGTAADIIKMAMITCRKNILEKGLRAQMVLQIHDELIFELPESEIEEAKPLLKKAMEGVMQEDRAKSIHFNVPLTVNFDIGNNLNK